MCITYDIMMVSETSTLRFYAKWGLSYSIMDQGGKKYHRLSERPVNSINVIKRK